MDIVRGDESTGCYDLIQWDTSVDDWPPVVAVAVDDDVVVAVDVVVVGGGGSILDEDCQGAIEAGARSTSRMR